MIVSSRGGMDVEEVAQSSPQDIHKEPIDFTTGASVLYYVSGRNLELCCLSRLVFLNIMYWLSSAGLTKEQAQKMANYLGFSPESIDSVSVDCALSGHVHVHGMFIVCVSINKCILPCTSAW